MHWLPPVSPPAELLGVTHPAEFLSTRKWHRAGILSLPFPGSLPRKASVLKPDWKVRGSVAALQGRRSEFPRKFTQHCSEKQKESLPSFLQVVYPTLHGRLFEAALPSPRYPCWAQFHGGRESISQQEQSKCKTQGRANLWAPEVPSAKILGSYAMYGQGKTQDRCVGWGKGEHTHHLFSEV